MTATLLSADAQLAALIAAAGLAVLGLVLHLAGRWPSIVSAVAVGAFAAATAAGFDAAIDWWLGARTAGATGGSPDFDESRWLIGGPWSPTARALALAAAVAVVIMSWIGSRRVTAPLHRSALVGLRAGAVAAGLCLFFQPSVELRQVTREPNRLAVLIDDSASMGLADKPDGPTRIQRAAAVIDASRDTFDGWADRHMVDFYRFSDVAVPLGADLATLAGDGKATLIRNALEQIRSRYQGRDLAAVLLISDGVPTGDLATGGAGQVAGFLRSLDAPVHTLQAAPPGIRDVAVAEVLADEFAFVRTVFRIEAIIRTTGFEERRVQVTLSAEGKPSRTKWVDLPAGTGEARVVFEMTPPKLGRFVYQIDVPAAEGEAVTANNSRAFVVRVIRDKIRVLQVAGRPSWDVRALRGMLKRNPNVDLISFFILRTNEDFDTARNSELSLIRFPTRELFLEELPSFDLVVLQNFNFGPYGISPYLENIRSYVEGGGALAVLGGDLAFANGGYAGTPVEAALPVLLPPSGPDAVDIREFKPSLTTAGKAHPITALRAAPADNLKAWAALPKLVGANQIRGLRKGSVALATHPRVDAGRKPMPVIVVGQYGDGRTLAVMTDSLWRWGFTAAQRGADEGRAYLKFWENATRWLLDDPDFRYLRVETDRVAYEPGATPQIDIRLLDRDYKPASGEVKLSLSRGADPGAVEAIKSESLTTDPRGRGRLETGELEAGIYRLEARADVSGYPAEARDVFVVRDASAELDHPAPSSERLEAIALYTGGVYLGTASEIPGDLPLGEPRIVRVDRRRELELWSRPVLLVLALLLLGFEWALRHKWGYR
jgi:uncharacterized membrane protein